MRLHTREILGDQPLTVVVLLEDEEFKRRCARSEHPEINGRLAIGDIRLRRPRIKRIVRVQIAKARIEVAVRIDRRHGVQRVEKGVGRGRDERFRAFLAQVSPGQLLRNGTPGLKDEPGRFRIARLQIAAAPNAIVVEHFINKRLPLCQQQNHAAELHVVCARNFLKSQSLRLDQGAPDNPAPRRVGQRGKQPHPSIPGRKRPRKLRKRHVKLPRTAETA